jgi:hypothetical protein
MCDITVYIIADIRGKECVLVMQDRGAVMRELHEERALPRAPADIESSIFSRSTLGAAQLFPVYAKKVEPPLSCWDFCLLNILRNYAWRKQGRGTWERKNAVRGREKKVVHMGVGYRTAGLVRDHGRMVGWAPTGPPSGQGFNSHQWQQPRPPENFDPETPPHS